MKEPGQGQELEGNPGKVLEKESPRGEPGGAQGREPSPKRGARLCLGARLCQFRELKADLTRNPPVPLVLRRSLLRFSLLRVDQMPFWSSLIYPEKRVLVISSQSEWSP